VSDSSPLERAAHLRRVRRIVLTDLLILGHYEAAEEAVAPLSLLDAVDDTITDCNTAFALGIYMLNRQADYGAATRWFARACTLASAGQVPTELFWHARFHMGLANHYRGEQAAARAIADELRDPPAGYPAVPSQYLERLYELDRNLPGIECPRIGEA
jgi:hypothetical protein